MSGRGTATREAGAPPAQREPRDTALRHEGTDRRVAARELGDVDARLRRDVESRCRESGEREQPALHAGSAAGRACVQADTSNELGLCALGVLARRRRV